MRLFTAAAQFLRELMINARRQPLIAFILLFVLLLLASWIYWFFTNHELLTEDGYNKTQRANINPYYASELLVNQHHQTVNADADTDEYNEEIAYSELDFPLTSMLDKLDESNVDDDVAFDVDEYTNPYFIQHNATLVVHNVSNKLTEEKFQQLMRWVESGGHIITFAHSSIDLEDLETIQNRLNELKTAQATSEQIHTDEQLNDTLEELESYSDNRLLSRLGIYNVDVFDHSAEYKNADKDDEADEKDEGEEGDEEENDGFEDHLDELGLKLPADYKENYEDYINNIDDDEEKGENNSKQNAAKKAEYAAYKEKENIRSFLQEWYYAKPLLLLSENSQNSQQNAVDEGFALTAQDIKTLTQPKQMLVLGLGHKGNQLNGDLYHALYPDSRSYQQLTDVDNISDIRQYFKQQLNQLKLAQNTLQAALKSTQENQQNADSGNDKSNRNNDKSNSSKNDELTDKQKINKQLTDLIKKVEWLLKLDDQYLQNILMKKQDVLFDSQHGQGRITVLADNDIWENPSPTAMINASNNAKLDDSTESALENPIFNEVTLGINLMSGFNRITADLSTLDNSELLLELTKHSSEVWFLPKTDINILPVILWRNVPLALIGFLIFLLFWMWSLFNRFGKPAKLDNRQAYDILTYFRQVGRYGWEHDHANKLSQVTRAQVQSLIKQRLNLNGKQQITPDMLPELSQQLQNQLTDKLEQTVHKTETQTNELHAYLVNNKAYLQSCLTAEALTHALLPTNQMLSELGAQEFAEHTQTLWLIKWLFAW